MEFLTLGEDLLPKEGPALPPEKKGFDFGSFLGSVGSSLKPAEQAYGPKQLGLYDQTQVQPVQPQVQLAQQEQQPVLYPEGTEPIPAGMATDWIEWSKKKLGDTMTDWGAKIQEKPAEQVKAQAEKPKAQAQNSGIGPSASPDMYAKAIEEQQVLMAPPKIISPTPSFSDGGAGPSGPVNVDTPVNINNQIPQQQAPYSIVPLVREQTQTIQNPYPPPTSYIEEKTAPIPEHLIQAKQAQDLDIADQQQREIDALYRNQPAVDEYIRKQYIPNKVAQQELMAESERVYTDMKNPENYKPYWETKSTGNKIAALLGVFLGTVGSRFQGMESKTWDMIQDAIADDYKNKQLRFEKNVKLLERNKLNLDIRQKLEKDQIDILKSMGFGEGYAVTSAMLEKLGRTPTLENEIDKVYEGSEKLKNEAAKNWMGLIAKFSDERTQRAYDEQIQIPKVVTTKETEQKAIMNRSGVAGMSGTQMERFIALQNKRTIEGVNGSAYENAVNARAMVQAFEKFAADPNQFTDHATLLGTLKTAQFDKSVVQREELKSAGGGSAEERIKNLVSMVEEGKTLTPEQRARAREMVNTIADIYAKKYMQAIKPILKQSERLGIHPDEVINTEPLGMTYYQGKIVKFGPNGELIPVKEDKPYVSPAKSMSKEQLQKGIDIMKENKRLRESKGK
jgi:hypothetical protein